jgi:hypothetical protein
MSSVQITNGEVGPALAALIAMRGVKVQKGVTLKFVMSVKRAVDSLTTEQERIGEMLKEIADPFLEKDEDGKSIVNEDGSSTLRVETREEYVAVVNAMLGENFNFQTAVDFSIIENFMESLADGDSELSIGSFSDIVPILSGGK